MVMKAQESEKQALAEVVSGSMVWKAKVESILDYMVHTLCINLWRCISKSRVDSIISCFMREVDTLANFWCDN